jgi:NADPH-dependent 2,4-dienoyl-CoA reductase/sulfur reductase-like enzyme/rhodanese-related sulfurtransferase
MRKRLIIVGGVAAGASAAAKARRTNEDAEIVMFESGPYMSFANCGLPYYVGGEIGTRDALFVSNPRSFSGYFRVDVRLNSTVTQVMPDEKRVVFEDAYGKENNLAYDRLVLATGTVPIVPPIQGLDGPNIFLCRTVPDVDEIMSRLGEVLPREMEGGHFLTVKDSVFRALIIGGGYIGLECAEQLMQHGFQTTVVEAQDQLMGPLDRELAHPVQLALQDAGARVILHDGVVGIEPVGNRSKATLASGKEIVFDIAIVGTGVRPNVELANEAGLTLGKTGALAVDSRQRTSSPSVFAAGDNCEAVFLPTGEMANIPLAGPANKQGRVAGHNAALDLMDVAADDPARLSMRGVLGTAIVRVCGVVAGGTGLTEKVAKQTDVPVSVAYVIGPNHAGYYPNAQLMLLKLVYAPDSGRLLGAQAVGRDGVDKRLDVLATAIQGAMTVEDLEQLDLCYAPPFGSAKDVTIMAGFVAANAYRGTSPGASPFAVMQEMSTDAPPFLLDVRSEREYEGGCLEAAVNIPLEQLRDRLSEIPRQRPVVVQCASGYRSYLAQQILMHHGWNDVRNLYGGFGLSRRICSMMANGGKPELPDSPR